MSGTRLTTGSLFAGIGGFDLAAEAMGWDTRWFVERDASCQHWLAEHFPGRPIYGDIATVDFTEVEPVDVLCGGFPCQPASAAGKRLGTADDRWLWPHFARAIGQIRPRYVVAENVPGLLSVNGGRAFAEVLRDLAALGYDAEWRCVSAADVGAPHERERVWIVAYAGCVNDGADQSIGELWRGRPTDHLYGGEAMGRNANLGDAGGAGREEYLAPAEPDQPRHVSRECALMGHANGRRCGEFGEPERAGVESTRGRIAHGSRLVVRPWADAVAIRGADGTSRLIPREAGETGPESPLWPVVDGIPGRVARLRSVGNAVVPQAVIEGAFRVVEHLERAS